MEKILLNPLIIVRDIHFASSVIVAGIIFFDLFIASPVLGRNSRFQTSERSFRRTADRILWICVAFSVTSAFAWLCLLSTRIVHKPLDEVLTDGTVWTMLSQTQFGFAWQARLVLAVAFAICLLWQSKANRIATNARVLASLLAAGYVALLAFAGHGGEGLGRERIIHLAADALHLLAAALWLGALIPFVLLLSRLQALGEEGCILAASAVGNRFSTSGILAVGILLVSGTINASFLLVGVHSLIDTPYGRLLLLKILLFATMLGLAGVNRQHLLPKLCDPAASHRIFRYLFRNSMIEIALGLAIVLIVGMIGVMPPANEIAPHVH